MLRKEGGKGSGRIRDSVDASISFEECIKGRRERLIIVTRNNIGNTNINRTKITSKQKWGKKTNSSMDIRSDKPAKSRTRKLEHDQQSETLREKQNLF